MALQGVREGSGGFQRHIKEFYEKISKFRMCYRGFQERIRWSKNTPGDSQSHSNEAQKIFREFQRRYIELQECFGGFRRIHGRNKEFQGYGWFWRIFSKVQRQPGKFRYVKDGPGEISWRMLRV